MSIQATWNAYTWNAKRLFFTVLGLGTWNASAKKTHSWNACVKKTDHIPCSWNAKKATHGMPLRKTTTRGMHALEKKTAHVNLHIRPHSSSTDGKTKKKKTHHEQETHSAKPRSTDTSIILDGINMMFCFKKRVRYISIYLFMYIHA